MGKISSVEVILQAISRITAIDIRSMPFQDDVLNEQENKPRVSIIFFNKLRHAPTWIANCGQGLQQRKWCEYYLWLPIYSDHDVLYQLDETNNHS